MHFQHKHPLQASRERLWPLLQDVQQTALSIPGIESVRFDGNDVWIGALRVHMGPFSIGMEARVTLVEKHLESCKMVMGVSINDARIGGGVVGKVTMWLEEAGKGSILVADSDFAITGLLQNARPELLKEKADEAMNRFAASLDKRAQSPG